MARAVDAVVIGSGHNALVAAAYLARAGWGVEVLERNPVLGGAVATEELTLPGFRHDTFSSWHPLFAGSPAYAELGEELAVRGLRYRNTDAPAAAAYGDGHGLVAWRDPERTAGQFAERDRATYLGELERFGALAGEVFALLSTELYSASAAALVGRLARKLGPRGTLAFAAQVAESASAWLRSRFAGPEPGLLWAPWVLHTGLAPDGAGGALQIQALVAGLHQGGMPVVEGGSDRFVAAFRRLIEDHGGACRTGVDVTRVLVRGGRAVGVVAGDEEVRATRAVLASVTPTQLYGRLLQPGEAPDAAFREAERYRYGRGDMQIHLALDEPLRWRDERLAAAAVVHVTDGIEQVSLACAQAAAGLLPDRPTVVVGQPTAVDPTRAPDGRAIGWIQLQETPYAPEGDAAGQLEPGGTWTPELAEAYADRVLDRVAAHAPNLRDALRARAILTPADLERRNINLVRGDPYGGSTELDQSYLWRPLRTHGSHRTPVDGLWHIGASTYPGPGLNAASGRIVARRLLASADGPPALRAARRALGGLRG
jgi:phytoene dehydrogenase-like protein